jgi:pyrroloquinoline quinone biosynthesis protein E
LLTGDPANADPVCDKSPHHEAVINVVRKAAVEREPDEHPIMFRNDANSRLVSGQPAKQMTPA